MCKVLFRLLCQIFLTVIAFRLDLELDVSLQSTGSALWVETRRQYGRARAEGAWLNSEHNAEQRARPIQCRVTRFTSWISVAVGFS